MKADRVEHAVSYFEEGFACSQAVFASFAESLGLESEIALKIGDSFGGGMGGMAETCGAVTGAFMAIGLKQGRTQANDSDTKAKNRALVKAFVNTFKERHGSITCKTLLEVDISTEEGNQRAREKELFKTHCPKFVRSAAEILQQLLEK